MSNIKLFEEKRVRSAWNETEQQWYFSVQDVIQVLIDSADVKQYVKRMRQRDAMLDANWGTICSSVENVPALKPMHIPDDLVNILQSNA